MCMCMHCRSLLSNAEGYITLLFTSDKPISYMAYVWGAIKKKVDYEATEGVRGMQITADGVRLSTDTHMLTSTCL